MIGSFKNNLPFNHFLLILFVFLLHWSGIIHASLPLTHHSDSFLYKWLIADNIPVFTRQPWLNWLLICLIVVFQSFMLNHLAMSQKLFLKPHYLPGMTFVLFTAQLSVFQSLSGSWIAAAMMCWVLLKCCQLHHLPEAGKTLFNLGLLTGMASLFYFSSMIFLLLIMIALMISRPFRLSEWTLVFVGFFTPVYFILALLYLNDMPLNLIMPDIGTSWPVISWTQWEMASAAIILLTFLSGWFLVHQNMLRLLVQSRKSWSLIFIYCMIAAVVSFLDEMPSLSNTIFLFGPIALIAAAVYHYPTRRWFPNLSYWSLIILSVVIGYFFVFH